MAISPSPLSQPATRAGCKLLLFKTSSLFVNPWLNLASNSQELAQR